MQALALLAVHVIEPVFAGLIDHQHVATGVVALADFVAVHQGTAQDHIGELGVFQGAVDCFPEAATERAQFQAGEFVAVVIAAGRAQQATDQRAGAQGMPQRHRIQARAAHRTGTEAGGGQLGLADAPELAGALTEQVTIVRGEQVAFLPLQATVLIKIFHRPAQALLPFALPVMPPLAQFGQQRLGRFVLAQAGTFLMAEHVDQGIGDMFQGLAVAAKLEGLQVFQRRIQGLAPVRRQLPEAA